MPTFEGWHTDDDGSPRSGKSVFYRAASDAEPNPNPIETPTVVTDSSGHWTLTTPAGEWDLYLLDGPTVRMWKARTNLPLSFSAEQIAPGADIELTKLDEGTGDDDVNPATAPTNLDQRINQILSQIKDMSGLPNWNDPPVTTLVEADNHIPNPGGVHGFAAGVSLLGTSQGAGGFHAKWGLATCGAEELLSGVYYAAATVVFAPTFPSACQLVLVSAETSHMWAAVQNDSVHTGGFVGYVNSHLTGPAGQSFYWFAIGY